MVDCLWVFRWLYAYLDESFTASGGQQIEEHIDLCRSCYLDKEFGLFLKRTIRKIERESPVPEYLKDEFVYALD